MSGVPEVKKGEEILPFDARMPLPLGVVLVGPVAAFYMARTFGCEGCAARSRGPRGRRTPSYCLPSCREGAPALSWKTTSSGVWFGASGSTFLGWEPPAPRTLRRRGGPLHRAPESVAEAIAKGEQLKEELIAHPSVREFPASVWTDTKAAIVKHGEGSTTGEGGPVARGVMSLGETMLEDPELPAKVDGWLLDATLYVDEQYRTEVGQFIADTVRGWDPEDTSRKIELAVERDLQFIRINGTIMGALVGLILYLIGLAL